jgi:hypothetical protein
MALVLPVVFVLCHKHENRPPDNPAIPTGPSSGLNDSSYAFTTSAIDPDGDSVSYRFYWGDSTQTEWSPFVPSGTTWGTLKTWTGQGVFLVRVRAQDNHGLTSGLSLGLSVSISNVAPLRPAPPTGPDTADGGQTCWFRDSTQDPNGDSIAYQLDWGDGDTSLWTGFVPSGTITTPGHYWLTRGSYLVRVRAKDDVGSVSDWSEPHPIQVSGPTLRWRCLVGGRSSYSSPAVGTDGAAYVRGQADDLCAVNPDGSLRWRSTIPGGTERSPAVGLDGTVYLDEGSYLYAVRAGGALHWRLSIGDASTRNGIALFEDTTILCRAGGLSSVSKTGTVRWVCRTGVPASCPAVGVDGAVYFQSNDSVYALYPDSSIRWRSQFGSSHYTSPAIGVNGMVCIVGSYGALSAFDQTGNPLWSVNVDDDRHHMRSTPSVGSDGTIYCGFRRGLQAVSADGTKGWLFPTSKEVRTSPAIAADGTIYSTCEDAILYALNSDGSVKWRYHIPGRTRSSPAIAPDGAVYLTSSDGYLYVLEGTAPLASSPWPMYLHDARHTGWAGTP